MQHWTMSFTPNISQQASVGISENLLLFPPFFRNFHPTMNNGRISFSPSFHLTLLIYLSFVFLQFDALHFCPFLRPRTTATWTYIPECTDDLIPNLKHYQSTKSTPKVMLIRKSLYHGGRLEPMPASNLSYS